MRSQVAVCVSAAVWALLATTRTWADTALTSDTAPVELTCPDGWAKLPATHSPDHTVSLVATDARGELGAAVVFEPKTGLGIGLGDYAAAVLDQMDKRGTNPTHTAWQHVKAGNGTDALQCDVHMTRAKVKLAYAVTVFETADSFVQVLGWSVESAFGPNRATLAGLANGFRQTGPARRAAAAGGPPVTVKARDGLEQMVLPAGWTPTPHHSPDTQLMAVNQDQGTYVQLISENRADFTFTLAEYADRGVDTMLRRGTEGRHTPWKPAVINGHDALRCEVYLSVKKFNFGYVYTVLQTPDRFQQVVAWTGAGAFDDRKADLEKLADDVQPVPSP